MNFSQAINTCFSKYVTWQGRAPRSEYWWFFLFTMLIGIVFAMFVTLAIGLNAETIGLMYLPTLVTFLPSLSVLVRRLHDTNRSGWWYWLILVPLVGPIIMLVWMCSKGTVGPNDYGEDPLS